jgi:ammonia channel protein AmtB
MMDRARFTLVQLLINYTRARSSEEEKLGLDMSQHGEEAYIESG